MEPDKRDTVTVWSAKDLNTELYRSDEHISTLPVTFKPVKGAYQLRLTLIQGVARIFSILRLRD